MSLEKLEEKLSSLSEETKSLYNKIDEKYRITINGKGSLELVNISNFKVLARGKKKIKEAMKKLLDGARWWLLFSCSEALEYSVYLVSVWFY